MAVLSAVFDPDQPDVWAVDRLEQKVTDATMTP
jgi:hypothetical protein